MSGEEAAVLRGVAKTYRTDRSTVEALRGVDLAVPEGDFLAVMGASGSGKSTLLHVLAGLTAPDAGTVTVAGEDLAAMGDAALTRFRRRRIGIVFQAYNLVPVLTARENVALPLILDGVARVEALAKAGRLLDLVELGARAEHRPDALSGGEQQRVAIARALVADPALILADEPTGNLDSRAAELICALLARLNRDEGRTVVVVTHEALVAHHAGRVVVLADGRVRGELARADHPDAAALARAYLAMVAGAEAGA